MLKVPLMDYTNPLYHWDFSTRWVEKESEIGLFFDLALCLYQILDILAAILKICKLGHEDVISQLANKIFPVYGLSMSV